MIFDEEKATRAIRVMELLKLTGDFHGQSFKFEAWNRKIVSEVYGTYNERGFRQFRDVYVELPKKNTKSLLGCNFCIEFLFDKFKPNGLIYFAGADKENARETLYQPLVEIIEQVPALIKRVKITDSIKEIVNKETGTRLKVLSSDVANKHGPNASLTIMDEIHSWHGRELYDILTHGTGLARRDPLRIVLTTAGDDPDRVTIGWELHERAKSVIEARKPGGDMSRDIPTLYPVIFAYDGDDIFNEANWYQANPMLDVVFPIESLRELAIEARLSPAKERLFRWLNLNQWTTSKLTAWLDLDLWDQTQGAEGMRQDLINMGKELDCFIGVDLSSTTDLTGLVVIFPPQPGLEKWSVLFDAFIPADNMEERVKRDKVPYDKWLADGFLHATPGTVIDFSYVKAQILNYASVWNVVEVGCDPALATWLFQQLDEVGIKAEAIPQEYRHQTEPMNLIEMLMKNDELRHELHPLARWNYGNASIHTNGSGMKKLVKESRGGSVVRTKRIDLIAAWVTGMSRAKFYDGAASIYNNRGLYSL